MWEYAYLINEKVTMKRLYRLISINYKQLVHNETYFCKKYGRAMSEEILSIYLSRNVCKPFTSAMISNKK